jgi:hypothetical protein
MGTGEPKPPSWEDIQHLIDRVDQVCRESEALRMHAERSMRRRDFWPDRRHPPRRHDRIADTPGRKPDGSPEGTNGSL